METRLVEFAYFGTRSCLPSRDVVSVVIWSIHRLRIHSVRSPTVHIIGHGRIQCYHMRSKWLQLETCSTVGTVWPRLSASRFAEDQVPGPVNLGLSVVVAGGRSYHYRGRWNRGRRPLGIVLTCTRGFVKGGPFAMYAFTVLDDPAISVLLGSRTRRHGR